MGGRTEEPTGYVAPDAFVRGCAKRNDDSLGEGSSRLVPAASTLPLASLGIAGRTNASAPTRSFRRLPWLA